MPRLIKPASPSCFDAGLANTLGVVALFTVDFTSGAVFDWVTRQSFPVGSNATFVATPEGPALHFNGSQIFNVVHPAVLGLGPQVYITAARIRATAQQGNTPGQIFGISDLANDQVSVGVGWDGSATPQVGGTWLNSNAAGVNATVVTAINKFNTVFSDNPGGNGAHCPVWVDGLPIGNLTLSGNTFTPNRISFGAQDRPSGTVRFATGDLLWGAIIKKVGLLGQFDSVWNDREAWQLYANDFPNCLFRRSRRLWKLAGGSIYNVSQAETVTAADLYSSLVAMVANDAETASLADAPASTAILPSALGEVASETDLVSNGSIYPAAIAEAPTAADLADAKLVVAAPDPESAALVDAPATTAILPSAQPESAPLVDAPSTKAVLPSAVGETAAQADLVNGALLVPGAVPEAASALDAPSTKAILPSAVGEAASATDVENAPPPGVETVAEVATAADLVSAQVIAGGGQAESAPLVDAPSARLVSPAAIAESSALADLVAAQANFAAALVELGFAADLPAARMIMATGLLEAGAAQDSPSADAAKIAAAKCNTLGSAERIRVLGSDTRIRILGGDCC